MEVTVKIRKTSRPMSLAEQARSVAAAAVGSAIAVAQGKGLAVSHEEAARRYAICQACPRLKEAANALGFYKKMRCEICGCAMREKAYLTVAKCADKENPRW